MARYELTEEGFLDTKSTGLCRQLTSYEVLELLNAHEMSENEFTVTFVAVECESKYSNRCVGCDVWLNNRCAAKRLGIPDCSIRSGKPIFKIKETK